MAFSTSVGKTIGGTAASSKAGSTWMSKTRRSPMRSCRMVRKERARSSSRRSVEPLRRMLGRAACR